MNNYDPGAIRRMLLEIFPDEEEFGFFCQDYFSEALEKFTEGMSFKAKAQALNQYCLQNNLFDKLLPLLQKNYPDKYQAHAASLFLVADSNPPIVAATQESPALAPTQPESTTTSPTSAATTAPLTDLPSAPPKTNDIFISYSRRDLAFVTQLHQELTNRGISAWFDKENIRVADHWRTSIVEGIRDCQAFVLVLSPDSMASENVRKEVDLAERYKKRIVPLMWRNTNIPEAMEYQLAGIQWMDFKETASTENFNEMTDVLQRLIGGASLTEATTDKSFAKESTIPAIPKEEPVAAPKLGGLKKKSTVNPITIGGSVISGVVTTFNLSTEKEKNGISEKDQVSSELKLLFSITDNFLKVRRGEVDGHQPVLTPKLLYEKYPAQVTMLATLDPFDLQIWEGQVESGLTRIRTHLRNLDILLKQEALMGEEGQRNLNLQNQIRGERNNIVKVLQELAELMNEVYGILVTSPEELADWLAQQ